MAKHMMTVNEVAKYLNMKVGTIYKHAQQGRIPAFKIGASWRFNRSTIDQWIRDQEKNCVRASTKRAGLS